MNKEQQKDEIISIAKNAICATSLVNDGYADRDNDVDNAAEDIADTLIENGYRKTFTSDFASDTQKAYKEGYQKAQAELEEKLEDGELVSKDWHDEQILHAENEIAALKDELRRVSEDSKERDKENLRLQAALDDASDKYKAVLESYERVCNDCVQQWKNGYNEGYDSGFEDGKEQVEKDSYERGFADGEMLIKEFAGKLKDRLNADYVNGGLNNNKGKLTEWDIDELLKEYEK